MRINYTEEEDFAGQFELWQANCQRSLNGKAGQAVLRELEAALVTLSSKRLIAKKIASPWGEVCAVGALLVARREALGMTRDAAISELLASEEYQTDKAAIREGVPRLVAWKLVALNDMELDHCSPEERYGEVLAWVRAAIVEAEVQAGLVP